MKKELLKIADIKDVDMVFDYVCFMLLGKVTTEFDNIDKEDKGKKDKTLKNATVSGKKVLGNTENLKLNNDHGTN